MKGSSIFQGVKSWPWKIHQQLPLSVQESQRLLGALTSSFRQHLDEVHPTKAADDHRPRLDGDSGQTRPDLRALHSSAAAADRHLSSILTNPLLARNARTVSSNAARKADEDYANAMMQLQKQHAKDPVSLLEEYQEQGIATLPIADLCLQKHLESLENQGDQRTARTTQEVQAGRRVLLWLFRTARHTTPEFANREGFIPRLVTCLMEEGQEQILWDWLNLDVALNQDDRYENEGAKRKFYIYRWKGRVLRSMVDSKLGGVNKERKSADEALEVFFQACKIKMSASWDDPSKHCFPLGHAGGLLNKSFVARTNGYPRTTPQAFEKFIDTIEVWQEWNPMQARIQRAVLWLEHPTRPTGEPFLTACRELLSPEATEYVRKIRLIITNPLSVEKQRAWFSITIRAAVLLERQSNSEDARELVELVEKFYSAPARLIETEKVKYSREYDKRLGKLARPTEDVVQERATPRVPFPTFT